MPARPMPQPDPIEEQVRAANSRFYAAFESLDITQMDAVWTHEGTCECVHPGWDLLVGWEEIHDSWARIFSNTKRIRLALSSVWIRVEGDVAWVACTEHITSAFADGFDEAIVQATNIFIRSDGEWCMAARHASPLPAPQNSTVQ
jgi:ketosteroid isomerase-like protein